MTDTKMPLQPIEYDEHGVIRFRENKIVRYLLDAGPFDMNKIAVLPGISVQERAQFAAMIGYSVSGWGDLSYVQEGCPDELAEADRIADELYEAKKASKT